MPSSPWTTAVGKPASKTSGNQGRQKQFALGGMVTDGLFTVGEQGPELGYKHGADLQIFSNTQSRALSMRCPQARRPARGRS